MRQKFQASVQHEDGVTHVTLAGVIDEDSSMEALAEQIPPGKTVFHLQEIRFINSSGVRDWVNALRRLEARGAAIELAECAPPIVAQLNMVAMFVGHGRVQSFYLPYICPTCDADKQLLVEADQMGRPYQPPPCTCDRCGAAMEFDDLPDAYFGFLSDQQDLEVNAPGPRR